MADLSVTVGSVGAGTGNVTVNNSFNAAVTVTAGQMVYLDSANVWRLLDVSSTAALAGSGGTFGMALHGSLAGQPLAVQTGGTIDPGATVVVGKLYVGSATAGGICPIADITTQNHYVTLIGIGESATTINMSGIKKYTGVQIP